MVRLARRDHVVERAEARRVDRERIAVHGPRWVDFLSAAFDPKRASVHDAPTTTTVLDLLADYGAVGAPRPMLSDIVATAARRLVDQLADWDDDPADLFADNIDLDEPLAFDARRPSSW